MDLKRSGNNPEIVILTAFGHLSAKKYCIMDTPNTVIINGEYSGEYVDIVYKDSGETKYINGKRRRIFNLSEIRKR
jgi:hypothetical protein